MLVTAEEMLKKAKAGKYAVGQFNINNLEWTKAILATAQELQSPVILGVSEGAGKYMTGFGFAFTTVAINAPTTVIPRRVAAAVNASSLSFAEIGRAHV